MSEEITKTIKYIAFGVCGVLFGFLSHKTDPFFKQLERSGTGYRWILWGRYAVGTVGLFATSLMYFVGRRLGFVEALGVFSQASLNYGAGVVIGHIADELKAK